MRAPFRFCFLVSVLISTHGMAQGHGDAARIVANAAPTADRPSVKPGDRWTFAVWYTVPTAEPSRTWVITSVGPGLIEGTENGQPLKLTPDLNVLESPRDRHSDPNGLRFPMTVGQRWRYASDWWFAGTGGKGTTAAEVEVTGFEKVKVPAGEFEAFRLVRKDKIAGTSPKGSLYDAVIVSTYWYAPAARAVVKLDQHNPYNGPMHMELVAFAAAP
jgi:hypothetical protein